MVKCVGVIVNCLLVVVVVVIISIVIIIIIIIIILSIHYDLRNTTVLT